MLRHVIVLLSVAALVVAGLLAETCSAESAVELPQVHKQKGYTIKLPEEWVAIPRDVLDEREELMADLTPDKTRPHFDCGFQLRDREWFDGPVILVINSRRGRIPDRELKHFDMGAFQRGAQDGIDRTKKTVPFALELEFGKTVYEPKPRILWTSLVLDTQDLGSVKQLIGMRVTEQGHIGVYGMCPLASFDEYGVIFEQVVRNVEIDERLRYRPRGMGVHDVSTLAAEIGFYALIAAGVVWLVRRSMRKGRVEGERP